MAPFISISSPVEESIVVVADVLQGPVVLEMTRCQLWDIQRGSELV